MGSTKWNETAMLVIDMQVCELITFQRTVLVMNWLTNTLLCTHCANILHVRWFFTFQNDFILPDSSVKVAGGLAIVPSVIQAVSVARERGVFVIWVS